MDFEIWNARRPTDNARWRAVHDAWRHREVFAHPSYVGLFAGPDDVPMAAYAATDHGFVLYPFVLRPVDATHLRAAAGRPLRDITSAYGYGGPFHSDIDEVAAKNFWSRFDDFCRGQGVVTEFVRIPVLRHHLLPYPGQVEPKLTNVVRDLTTPPGVMWYEFEHKVRKNVKRARQRGVTVEVDEHGAHLDDFLRIYHGTMRRRAADAAYHFPRHMFERLGQELPGQFVFFHARHGGEIVSTELVLVSADHIYSYLGGTVAAAFDVRPNDLLKFAIIEWGRQHGKTSFVLGGVTPRTTASSGTSAPSPRRDSFRTRWAAGCWTNRRTSAWCGRTGPRDAGGIRPGHRTRATSRPTGARCHRPPHPPESRLECSRRCLPMPSPERSNVRSTSGWPRRYSSSHSRRCCPRWRSCE
ncbi:GNAT family N-acetyltransferase [Micromonospora zhanjiangensis]